MINGFKPIIGIGIGLIWSQTDISVSVGYESKQDNRYWYQYNHIGTSMMPKLKLNIKAYRLVYFIVVQDKGKSHLI